MKKTFWVPITLALAAYLAAPAAGAVRAAVEADRREARAARPDEEARRACSPPRSRATRTASRASRVRSRPRRTGSGACSRASTSRRTSCSRCATGSRRRATGSSGCAASWSPPGRVLAARLVEIYKADAPGRAHRDPRGRRLRRPARARRVPRPDLGPGPRDHRRGARAARPARRTRPTSSPSLEQPRAAGRRADPPRARPDRVGARSSSCRRAASSPSARTDRRGALAQVRAQPRRARGRPRRARGRAGARGRRRSRARGGNTFAGPIKQGSGQLIWPVNGPVVSGFGMRWGRLHAGLDIAVPAGTPIRAADSGPRRAHGLGRRLRQLHLHPAHRLAVHLLRPPVELRDLERRRR